MVHEYKEYFYKEDTHTLILINCRNCDIEILASEKLCDVCRVNLVEEDVYKRQKDLWKRYVYNPWKRGMIKEWK